MALRSLLADEVLRYIADFLQSALLSHVCRRTWRVLQRRYLAFPVYNDLGLHRLHDLRGPSAVHSLSLRFHLGTAHWLGALKDFPLLARLTLDLRMSRIAEPGLRAIAALKEAPALTTLHVDLSNNLVADAGAQWLAALREAPLLCDLALDLCSTNVGDRV